MAIVQSMASDDGVPSLGSPVADLTEDDADEGEVASERDGTEVEELLGDGKLVMAAMDEHLYMDTAELVHAVAALEKIDEESIDSAHPFSTRYDLVSVSSSPSPSPNCSPPPAHLRCRRPSGAVVVFVAGGIYHWKLRFDSFEHPLPV